MQYRGLLKPRLSWDWGRLSAIVAVVECSLKMIRIRLEPQPSTRWERRGLIPQSKSELLARVTPEVIVADQQRRQMVL